jgi:hypothetical protein
MPRNRKEAPFVGEVLLLPRDDAAGSEEWQMEVSAGGEDAAKSDEAGGDDANDEKQVDAEDQAVPTHPGGESDDASECPARSECQTSRTIGLEEKPPVEKSPLVEKCVPKPPVKKKAKHEESAVDRQKKVVASYSGDNPE